MFNTGFAVKDGQFQRVNLSNVHWSKRRFFTYDGVKPPPVPFPLLVLLVLGLVALARLFYD